MENSINNAGQFYFFIRHIRILCNALISDNAEIMMGIETDDTINELFKSFLKIYQKGFETKMRGKDFVFESVDLLCYSLHKIGLNRGGSYRDSGWIKHKKATINQKTIYNKFLKDSITAALDHEKIKNHPRKNI